MTHNKLRKKSRQPAEMLRKIPLISETEIVLSSSPATSDSTIDHDSPPSPTSSTESKPELGSIEHQNSPFLAALIPSSLTHRSVLKGRIVRERIVAFFDDDSLLPHQVYHGNSDHEVRLVCGEFKPPVLLVDGSPVQCVVVVPNPISDRRLVRLSQCHTSATDSLISDDEFLLGLSLYGAESCGFEEQIKRKDKSSGATSSGLVPEYLVQFCKATSLASSATPNESITWDQVSMSVAIRAQPIASKAAALLDFIAGILALAIIAYYWQVICDWIDEQITVEERTLKERVEFVMSKHAPLGFKLNPQADFVLGNVVILVVDAWQYVIVYPALYTKEILIASCIFAAALNRSWGLSVLFAVSFDAFAVIGTHVGLLHRVISRILRFQLGLIGSLALLMRGKKRNVLRNRVDTLRTDSAQLMLGTMATFFFFFTLQTTLAYHILVLAVWFLIFVVQTVLFFICVVLRSLPLDDLFVAYSDSKHSNTMGAFRPRSIHLVYDTELRAWRLHVVPVSMLDIISDWLKSISTTWTRAWARRWGSQKVLLNALFGYELPTVAPPAV